MEETIFSSNLNECSILNFNIENILKNSNLFWQYPVITEETFYKQNKYNSNFF